jgi:bleomycin hydrolase
MFPTITPPEESMKKKRIAAVPAAVVALLALASCRPEEISRAERVAEALGRDQAVYGAENAGPDGKAVLGLDVSGRDLPKSASDFIRMAHLPPVRQGNTGTCWAFAATSLLESELRRLGKPETKLSEMHTVYWEYVEKARRFIREKGDSFLGQGSEPNSALERMKAYGAVRASDYPGLPPGGGEHDHSGLFREFREVLEDHAAREDWDEAKALSRVRGVLDRRLGRPPEKIQVNGAPMSPPEFLAEELGLDPADYVSFMSFLYAPFYTKGEFRVPDNWWHSRDYHNLPLYEFSLTLLKALRRGHTAVLAVDFSEPGYLGKEDVAVVPTFDIPSNFIDQSSREFRFDNGTSSDDHAVHCVGYREQAGDNWFLIKDSWENAYRGKNKGYFFYQDDYVRLKVLMFVVHRDAVKEVLEKFPAGQESPSAPR